MKAKILRSLSSPNGFTYIELLVALALLALIASVVIPVSDLTSRQQKERELKQALLEMRQAIDAYKLASDRNEIPEQYKTASGYPPNLTVLTGIPSSFDAEKPLRFLRRIPDNPFVEIKDLKPEDAWAQRSYISEANEPKAGEDVYDVYYASTAVGTNGISYNQW